MKKRKDKKGNVLREGERIRSDGRYEYRYTDPFGRRKSFYTNTLVELRRKEDELANLDKLDTAYSQGDCTALDLLDRYLATKKGVKQSTTSENKKKRNVLSREPFMRKAIRTIKTSDVKMWFIEMNKNGRKKEPQCKTLGDTGFLTYSLLEASMTFRKKYSSSWNP